MRREGSRAADGLGPTSPIRHRGTPKHIRRGPSTAAAAAAVDVAAAQADGQVKCQR